MFWARRNRSLASILDGLSFTHPFELAEFCNRIAEMRGKPLMLMPIDVGPARELPCGMWLGLDTVDFVFYDADAPEVLRTQIVLHEVSHMLLGHSAPELDEPGFSAADLLGPIAAELEVMEQQATPAAIIREEASRVRASAGREVDEELGLSADRMLSLLGRTGFKSRQERDAEHLATLILEKASRRPDSKSKSREGGMVDRLDDAFGHPVRIRK